MLARPNPGAWLLGRDSFARSIFGGGQEGCVCGCWAVRATIFVRSDRSVFTSEESIGTAIDEMRCTVELSV